jgi:hypothetical protein
LLACHSVDYDIHRQICYYGKHQGEPTIEAPGFASAHSMGCVGACSACSGGRCPTVSSISVAFLRLQNPIYGEWTPRC